MMLSFSKLPERKVYDGDVAVTTQNIVLLLSKEAPSDTSMKLGSCVAMVIK